MSAGEFQCFASAGDRYGEHKVLCFLLSSCDVSQTKRGQKSISLLNIVSAPVKQTYNVGHIQDNIQTLKRLSSHNSIKVRKHEP